MLRTTRCKIANWEKGFEQRAGAPNSDNCGFEAQFVQICLCVDMAQNSRFTVFKNRFPGMVQNCALKAWLGTQHLPSLGLDLRAPWCDLRSRKQEASETIIEKAHTLPSIKRRIQGASSLLPQKRQITRTAF